MLRDPLSTTNRQAKAMTAPRFGARVDVAIGPGGSARFDDGILEIAGDHLRVAARDVIAIELVPALDARLQLRVTYRRGSDTIRHRCWVPASGADDLRRLVVQVRGALRASASAPAA